MASVPQRSPFRYPGGKTWLVPRVRQWIRSLKVKPNQFIEPFAGGGIIGLTVAFEHLAKHVIMVELDPQVAAVWQTIIYGDARKLADLIAVFDCTSENVEALLSTPPQTLEESAFKTLVRNRVQHGGILAPGASLIKRGENGKGIRSRWYPRTLRQRIMDIAAIKERITFIEGDGIDILKKHATDSETIFFVDPPYTAAGKKAGARLYTYYEIDHEELFSTMSTLTGDFLMTYDNTEEIAQLARRHGFDIELIAMKNTHHARMTELLISRNLDWLRRG